MMDERAEILRRRDEEACDGFSELNEYLYYQSTGGAYVERPRRTDERTATTEELEALGSILGRSLERLGADLCDPEYSKCESPIEQIFFREFRGRFPRTAIRTQVRIGRYRIDFLIAGRLVVECDGAQFHGDDRADYDRQRDLDLLRLGYRTIRLSGREIMGPPKLWLDRIAADLAEFV